MKSSTGNPSVLNSFTPNGGRRLLILPFAVGLELMSVPAHASDALDKPITISIPSNTPLEDALLEWGNKVGVQVMMDAPSVARETTHSDVSGTQPARVALAALLQQSKLSYTLDNTTLHVVQVLSAGPPQGTTAKAGVPPKKTLAGTGSANTDARHQDLEEVLVTAQKREERLQDVPIPVTAVSATVLADNNQVRLQDYYSMVPGLTLSSYDTNGAPTLAIRGVTTGGFTNPTVGIMIDDVPFGASTGLGGGTPAPDIDPSDLARVEVLRGPQGTLYGASSMGGLLKFVTIDPSTDGFSARVQASGSTVNSAEGAGYGVRGNVNIPVSGTFAVRASGFWRHDPGYIENIQTGQRGINNSDVSGGRVSALWRPSDDASLKLSALYQVARGDGSSAVDVGPGLSGWQQSVVRDSGAFDRKVQAYSATANVRFGRAQLTSLTGYSVSDASDSFDFSSILGGLTEEQFGVTGTPLREHFKTKKFSQELRFAIPISNSVDWLIGAFYTHEDSPNVQEVFAADPTTGAVVGQWYTDVFPTTFSEYAAFTDVTVHFTDRFDVQIGGRASRLRQSYTETYAGIFDPVVFGLPSPVVNPLTHTRDNAVTYLVTPQFKFTDEVMLYARLASGYRAGGPNPTAALFGLPARFRPDKTKNYEVGVKGSNADRSFSVDASLYYIDWSDIQLSLIDPGSGQQYFANGSRAKSQGVELSVEAKPVGGLTISAWGTWNDAKLTQSLPTNAAVYGASGDRLPFSSRFSGSLSLEQSFALIGASTGFVGGTISYIGDRQGPFTVPPPDVPPRQVLPGYAKTDLRVGALYESWSGNIYVNNVTDRRGVLSGGLGALFPFAFTYIEPRTIGVTLTRTF